MTKPKAPLSLRVSEEAKNSYALLKEESGMTTEDLTLGMIEAFKSAKLEGNNSPLSAELKKVKQAFSTAERVVGAFLEIAENDKVQALDTVNNQTRIFSEKISLLEAEKADLKVKSSTCSEANEDLLKINTELTSKIEDTSALRDAWKSTEQSYQARITELDGKSKAIEPLSKENTELKTSILTLKTKIADLARVQEDLVKSQKLTAELETRSQICLEEKATLTTSVAVAEQKYSSLLEQSKTEKTSLEREIKKSEDANLMFKTSLEREISDSKDTILMLRNLVDNFKSTGVKKEK